MSEQVQEPAAAAATGAPAGGYQADVLADPAMAADPHPSYRAARRQAAVVPGMFGPQVVRRSAVEEVLHDPATFSSAMEAADLGQRVPLVPLQVDPPRHVTFRRLLDPIFAPKRMAALEPDVVAMVDHLIDGFIDRGSCDLATELAVPLPSSVFLRLLGLPLDELDDFLAMKDGILRPSGDDLDAMRASQKEAAVRIEEYFAAALADRRRRPQDDLLSMLMQAEVGGERLTEDEILGICFLFILAGLDTVTDSLECFFANLAQHADRRRQIVEDPGIIPTAVEELLRWETPVMMVPRMATRDVTVDGCPIAAGSHVSVCIGAANTDTDADGDDDEADELDLRRNPNRHLAFGGGIHRCLGSHLARVELRATLRTWHARIPEYELAPGTVLTYGWGLRQIDNLPLVFPA